MIFLTFLFAAVVVAITPGPGIVYVVVRTVARGHNEGLASDKIAVTFWSGRGPCDATGTLQLIRIKLIVAT